MQKSVKESKENLLKKLWSIEESGSTALGPALLLGLSMASSGSGARSKMILCTDGLANTGIGSLEGKKDIFTAFYTELAEQAKVKGVAVSVMTIIGTDCNVESLSLVTEQTGGEISRVDPTNLTANLSSIVSTRVLAYGAMAMVLLHRGLQFKGEIADEKENRNWMVKDLGNVTAESECSFSYAFRPKNECDLTGVDEIPFQVQLLYSRPNGMQCLRVATAKVTVTDDRKEAESNADVNVISTHVAARAAKMAKDGDYEGAQLEARAAQRFMVRNKVEEEDMSAWTEKAESMDVLLRKEKEREKVDHSVHVDAKSRQLQRDDEISTAISKNSKITSKKLYKK